MTNKKPKNNKRERVEPGIYKRGRMYEIRVTGYDAARRRRSRWKAVGTSIQEARRALDRARGEAASGVLPRSGRRPRLTVRVFIEDYFLPYLDERVNTTQNLHPNTAVTYRRYATQRVVPHLGHLRLDEVTSRDIEQFLNELRKSGRDPLAGTGRPRSRPDWVYEAIMSYRTEGWSFSDIAMFLSNKNPEVCAGMTKNSVAAIHRRHQPRPLTAPSAAGLSVSTVKKVYEMMRGVWAFGLKAELIPRERAHVIAEVEVPRRYKGEPEPEFITWTPEQYGLFFDWAAENHRSWVDFYFEANSGDRVSGSLGFRWDDIDLNAGIAEVNTYVKYHGVPGQRVLVESFGKTGGSHRISLEPRTIAILKTHRARQAKERLARTDRHKCPTHERNCPLPGYHDRGLVFPQGDGNYRDPNKFLAMFQRAIRAYNRANPGDPLPVITLHSLRRGWSTIAEHVGVTTAVRLDRMAQKSEAVNRRYTKAMKPEVIAAAKAVNDAMFGSSKVLSSLGT